MELRLTQGKIVFFDEEDCDFVSSYNWWPMKCAKPNSVRWYAYTTVRVNGKPRCFLMHRLLTQAPVNMQVDHWDRNGLNNRRSNLRLCDNRLNSSNRPTTSANGYRGVHVEPNGIMRFSVNITENGQNIHLGRYASIIEAALAYDDAARVVFGEFSVLNFPDKDTPVDSTNVSRLVHQMMREKNLTPAQLGRLCGLSSSVVSVILSGKRRINIDIASKIEAATGIKMRDLLVAQVDDDLDNQDAVRQRRPGK